MPFKIFNLFFYMTMAAKSFFNIYFSKMGLSSQEIGIINSVARGVAMFALPFWGIIADNASKNKRVLQFALMGVITVSLLLRTTSSFYIIMLLMVFYSIFSNPIRPLYDSMLFNYLGNKGNEYGRFRLWGTIGYTALVPFLGFFFENTTTAYSFFVLAGLMFISLIVSNKLPSTASSGLDTGGKKFANFKEILNNRDFVVFLVFVLAMQVTMNANLTYFPLYVLANGGKEGLFGLTKMVGSISEIIILLLSGKILARFKLKNIFVVSALSFALRWLILGLYPSKVIFLASQVLHSLSFGLFYVICVNYVNEVTSDKFRATAQNLFTATYIGLGSIIGNLVGGWMFDNIGGDKMYLIWSIVAFVAGISYFIYLKKMEMHEVAA